MQTLSSNLPPLPEDLSPAIRDALQALERLDDTDLLQLTYAQLPSDQYEQLTMLREQRRERALTPGEEATLNHLLEATDLLTLEKAYAAVLLEWRASPTSFSPDIIRRKCVIEGWAAKSGRWPPVDDLTAAT